MNRGGSHLIAIQIFGEFKHRLFVERFYARAPAQELLAIHCPSVAPYHRGEALAQERDAAGRPNGTTRAILRAARQIHIDRRELRAIAAAGTRDCRPRWLA